jgi:hypothetical protein
VLSNPAFATDKAEWDFVLIGTDMDDIARLMNEPIPHHTRDMFGRLCLSANAVCVP